MRTGLIGYPIGHSLSPTIHNAVYAELGLPWEYGLYPCEDRAAFLRTIAEAARNPDVFVGFNVTTPYKPDAYEACTEHSPFAVVTGSSNVLTFPVGVEDDMFGNATADAADGDAIGVAAVGATGGGATGDVPGSAAGDSPVARPRLRGDNTDGRGLVASLEREGGIAVAGSSVVLCGTGPVAMSALLALMEMGAASVDIASRDSGKGLERVGLLRERLDRAGRQGNRGVGSPLPTEQQEGRVDSAEPLPTERRGGDLSIPRGADGRFILPAMRFISYAEAATSLETADILIDATPLGMGAADGAVVPLEALRPGLVVFDAVYGHGETAIIRGAREAGAVAIDGLGMLIEQAALTVEIWAQERGTPVEVSRATMRRAALEQVLSVK